MTNGRIGLVCGMAVLFLGAGCGAGPQVQAVERRPAGYYVVAVAAPILQPAECCEEARNPKRLTRCLVYRGLAHYRLGRRAQALPLLRQAELLYRNGRRRWLPHVAVFEMHAALCDLETRGVAIQARVQPQVRAAISGSIDSFAPDVETIQ
jgi:hypothetical protein